MAHIGTGVRESGARVLTSLARSPLLASRLRPSMALERSRHQLGDATLIAINLPDRRIPRAPLEVWVFSHSVERALFGGNSGGLVKLLGRCSLSAVRATRRPACVAMLTPLR